MIVSVRQRVIVCIPCVFVLLASATALAQDESSMEGDPTSGTRLRTALEVGVDYTDNFFYARKSQEESGSGLLVRPEATLVHKLERFKFLAGASGEAGWYDFSGNADDYTDYALHLGSEWLSAPRHRFEFDARLKSGHDPFGTERTENTPLENRDIDTWRETRSEVTYHAGLPSDRLNFEVGVTGSNREYTNNEALTQFLSHERVSGHFTTYLNLTPKTAAFFVVAAQRTYFEDIAAFDRGATTLRYLVGARWAATTKTSGDLRLGYVDRDPRDSSRDDFQRFDWLAEITWAPRVVRKFLLQTGRAAQESFLNTVDFIDNRYGTLIWVEQWTSRLQTQVAGRYIESDFVGSSPNRQDELFGYSLSSEYRLTPYLTLLGMASSGQRDSELAFANYERFYAYVGARYAR